ncbi:tripartite tricarboxylate transporter TctB family protein [Variovorax dokdonensis]|uniref:Tripartite tricarboxylate transporter TctB family protein n=1 Tax=Variovorax dokdonensis TaxID=344883 RepID=A0ABT7N6B2_9BURK|nr:tripartite tricarboxylate transporter TctB family protein [Variovorax dokdonensis]MDM0043461.1 tripartite tricarboxylate transporter TctB family protein [Variovorax dokdonensis]
MEQEQISQEVERKGVATWVVEAVVAAMLLILGIVVMTESRRLGAGWTSDGPGAGYFPFYIGLIITISALGIFYQAVLSKKRNTEVFVDGEQLRRVLSVLVPAAVYVLGVSIFGLYIASAVYIALFMIVLGKFSWIKGVLVGVIVNTIFFCMFEVWFKVPLYKGMLDPLAFLGY